MSCCPPRWYCTESGPVEVEQVDGVYTAPDDAISGPFLTHDAARAACPFPPIAVTCADGIIEVPAVIYFTLTDLTGGAIGLWSVNSFAVLVEEIAPGSTYGTASITDINGVEWRGEFATTCDAGCGGAGDYSVNVKFTPLGAVTLSAVASTGWVADGAGTSDVSFNACHAISDPVPDPTQTEVAVVTITSGAGGSYTLYVS